MNQVPILETKRLCLRPLRPSDAKDLYHYLKDPEYAKYSGSKAFTDYKQAEHYITYQNNKIEQNQGLEWGLTRKGEDQIIGTCGFEKWSLHDYKAEIGFGLAKAYWHNGLMTEALHEVLHFGFNHLNLNRIEAIVFSENLSSRKLLVQCGFTQEGFLREYYCEDGQFIDVLVFSILKKEYHEHRLIR
jgi:[ribosomal protein S5]-alanine N-acetyltransferase